MRSFTPADWAWTLPDGTVFLSGPSKVVKASDPAVAKWSEPDGWEPTPCPADETGKPTLAALSVELGRWGLTLPGQASARTQYDFLSFLGLFSSVEQGAIIASDSPQVKLFCLMAAGASLVDLADLRTVSGVQELETLGLIGKGRAKQVLSGQAPKA